MSCSEDSSPAAAPPPAGGAASPPAPAAESVPHFLQEASPVTRLLQISGPSEWRTLLVGIDTLDLGFYARWGQGWDQLLAALDKGKANALNTTGVTWQHAQSSLMLILPKGRPMYGYALRHPLGIIYLSDKPDAGGYPNVYVTLLAEKLWQLGHRVCVADVKAVLASLGATIDRIQVSRVDLAADFHLPGGLSVPFLREHRVTRSRKSAQYLEGDDLETFYAGGSGSSIKLRIYNKSREILQSGKLWFCDLWKWDTAPLNIWRVEYQIRRDALKSFGIDALDDLPTKLGGVWANLTERWFSLRLDDNENRTRCTVHAWWQTVQALAVDLGSEILIERRRKPDTMAPVEWYVSHAAGYLVAYAARMGIVNATEAAAAFREEILAYWAGKDFADRYRTCRLKLNFDDSEGAAA